MEPDHPFNCCGIWFDFLKHIEGLHFVVRDATGDPNSSRIAPPHCTLCPRDVGSEL